MIELPVTSGTYAENERKIYFQLIGSGLNTAAACGILANIQAESGFNPMNLQNSYESSLGYTDKSYTNAVDAGTYKKFDTDSAGYGLIQWTYSTRKKELLSYARKQNKSIGDLTTQVVFLILELKKYYNKYEGGKSLWGVLSSYPNTAVGAYDAAKIFCKDFERPADKSAPEKRGAIARDKYWPLYSSLDGDLKETAKPVENKGSLIATIALNQAKAGIKYATGGNSPSSGFDDAGLVYYAYKEAGVPIEDLGVSDLYNKYKDTAKRVSLDNVAPGDLLFYRDNFDASLYVSIYVGSNQRVTSTPLSNTSIKDMSQSPTYILRILSDAQLGTDYLLDPSIAYEFSSLAVIDPYSSIVSDNLSKVVATGYDYGYLFDISHNDGKSFKFYIPEFSEHAGANWSNVEIRGRSVNIMSYEYTNSRVVTINLDLYAGAGVYAGIEGEELEDSVDRLHEDINFVRSLEYPDYTDAVVRPPATVHLVLGASLDMIGVVSDVTIEHLKPLDKYNRSVYIKLSFTVTQIAVDPPDYKDIRSGSFSINSTERLDSMYAGGTTIDKSTNAPIFSGSR